MKWELASSSADNETYHLYNGIKKLLTLIINPFTNTAKVECEKQKRVFNIRKEGFLRNKTILCNEYGVKIGELGQAQQGNFIDLNDERFFYTTQKNPMPELVMYKEDIKNPFVTCSLNITEENAAVHFSKNTKIADTSHPGLLMALCWYMFLPVTKENTPAFAVQAT